MAKSEIIFWLSGFVFLGIILGSFGFSLWWGFLPVVLLAGWFRYSREDLANRYVILFLLAVFAGIFYYHSFAVIKEYREILPQDAQLFVATVVSEPQFGDRSERFVVKLEPPYHGRITVITSPLADFRYGEVLELAGKIENFPWPKENTLVFPTIQKDSRISLFSLKKYLIQIKLDWLGNFKKIFSSDEAALLGGLTVGAKGDFDSDFKEAMKRSGTTHLVALSGYNISILILAASYFFRSRFSRRFFFLSILSLIIFFVLMVGAEASITRAAVMGILLLVASEAGRFYSFRHAILYAALGMSLWNPSLARFDLGFQLSFFSLLGIVLLEPLLSSRLSRSPEKGSFLHWRENLFTTLAAQIGVFPILMMNFGSVSLSSVLANVLILWLVPGVMALGFLTALFSMIHLSLAIIFQPLLHLALSFMTLVIKLSALAPLLEIPWLPWMSGLYYGFLAWIIYSHPLHEKS